MNTLEACGGDKQFVFGMGDLPALLHRDPTDPSVFRWGNETIEAASADAPLPILAAAPLDAIFTDISMPATLNPKAMRDLVRG